jgi:thiamine pyrophosphokinase
MKTIILADGAFPENDNVLNVLRNAERIVCCDGSVSNLVETGLKPFAIVGDLDSLKKELKEEYKDIIYPSSDQETNDLTKAVIWCKNNGYAELTIIGATGKREDHTLGNISLLADYSLIADEICILTDYGRIDPFVICDTIKNGNRTKRTFESFPGQQISIFSLTPETLVTSEGLKYEVTDRQFTSLWQGTLNESIGDRFQLTIDKGKLLIYRLF